MVSGGGSPVLLLVVAAPVVGSPVLDVRWVPVVGTAVVSLLLLLLLVVSAAAKSSLVQHQRQRASVAGTRRSVTLSG